MASITHIARNGEVIGTWEDFQIEHLYGRGKLLPTDMYWTEGLSTDWALLGSAFHRARGMSQRWFWLCWLFVCAGLGVTEISSAHPLARVLVALFSVALGVFALIKRLRNIGMSGWLCLLWIAPLPLASLPLVVTCMVRAENSACEGDGKRLVIGTGLFLACVYGVLLLVVAIVNRH
jgi:uncharacterized membrane protein YhaH (DUF805 family)